jgi:hypothetical protein
MYPPATLIFLAGGSMAGLAVKRINEPVVSSDDITSNGMMISE